MYLGNIPATSFEAVKKDRFTGLTGTGVTLSHSVSNVQDIVVWVNSVKQDYNNYTVSGTALTLGGSLVSADVVQVLYVGRTFQSVNPAADSVTASEIADNAISEEHLDPTIITGLTALASQPDDTDEFLVSDAGTLKRIDYSLIKGGGQFNLVTRTAITSDVSTVNFTNLEANTYHKFVLQGIDSTDNGGEDISARVSTDNGSSFINSNYQYAYYQFYSSGSTNTTGSGSGSTTADKWRFADGFHTSGSDEGLHGEFILYNVGNGQRPFFTAQTSHKADTSNRLRATVAGGTNTSGLTVNGVQFFFDSGDITGSSYAFITHYKGVIA